MEVRPTMHSTFRTVLRGSRSSSSGHQVGFRSLQKRFKALPSTYWASLLRVWVAYCLQMFPNCFLNNVYSKTSTFVSSRIGFDSFFGLQLALLGLPRAHQSLCKRFKTLENTCKISDPYTCCNRLLRNPDFWSSIKNSFASIKTSFAVEHQKSCFCTVPPSSMLP